MGRREGSHLGSRSWGNESSGKVATASTFSKELQDIFNSIGAEATEALEDAVTETAKEIKKEIQQNAVRYGWGSGYTNGWLTQKQKDSRFGLNIVIYHDAPDYRLVHLLEFGHRIMHAYGYGHETTSPAFPHVGPAAEKAEELLLEKFKENLE